VATRRAYIGEHTYGLIHWKKLNSAKERQEWSRAYFTRHGIPPVTVPKKVKEPGERVYAVSTPIIVERALWDRVALRLTRTRKASHRAPKRVPLLLGLLRCEECGREMKVTWGTSHTGQDYFFYRCSMHIKDRTRFPCRQSDRAAGVRSYVAAELIERRIWETLDVMLSDRDTLAAAIGAEFDEEGRHEPMVDERLGPPDRKRGERTQRAWDGARRAYFAGDVDAETFARDKEHYERELVMLREEMRMQRAAEERRVQADRRSELLAIAERWGQIREVLTEEERRQIVWGMIKEVTIDRLDNITVTGTVTGFGGSNLDSSGGRYWIRTSDLCDVNAAL
jgi:hypothetical protein